MPTLEIVISAVAAVIVVESLCFTFRLYVHPRDSKPVRKNTYSRGGYQPKKEDEKPPLPPKQSAHSIKCTYNDPICRTIATASADYAKKAGLSINHFDADAVDRSAYPYGLNPLFVESVLRREAHIQTMKLYCTLAGCGRR